MPSQLPRRRRPLGAAQRTPPLAAATSALPPLPPLLLAALLLALPALGLDGGLDPGTPGGLSGSGDTGSPGMGLEAVPSATSGAAARHGQGPLGNLHPGLARVLDSADPAEPLEVLARFAGQVTAADRALVKGLGIVWLDELTSLPVALLRGTAAQVRALAAHERVVWVEHNFPVEPLEPFMEQSLLTIDAPSNWYSSLLDVQGRPLIQSPNLQSRAVSIDGRGVTVAVIDTGTDAGHPDLDYREKVLFNKWCNLADPNDQDSTCVWVEEENTDHSYGHGTHVAGTIAGNGDASAGERRGVAPGANLVELGGDWLGALWAVAHALDWVYDNSKPGQNPYNIRLTSNSWGSAGDEQVYYQEDVLTLLIEKLVYQNNVAVVFAAGNAGEDNHDGSTVTTNPWSLVPASISVAAAERDGSGIAGFSSRGQADLMASWPDIAAPGVGIWSTAARGTFIDAVTKSQGDLYYLAISGTSMATPHVSGLVALMMQAAPSLRVSEVEEDNDGNYDFPSHERARIHEAELILKLTAEPIPASGDNGVPEGDWTGLDGRRLDFAQGYGLVNATRAVGVALTLQALRDRGYSAATVYQAYQRYAPIITSGYLEDITDRLGTSWRGEWSQFVDRSNPTQTYQTDQSHYLWIPEGAISADITFEYNAVDASTRTLTDLNLVLDADDDGQQDDLAPMVAVGGVKEYHLETTSTDIEWWFGITGTGFNDPFADTEFPEARAEYTVSVTLNLADGANVTLDKFDRRTDRGQWQPAPPSTVTTTRVAIFRPTFDLSRIDTSDLPLPDGDTDDPWEALANPWTLSALIVTAVVVGVGVGRQWTGRRE